MIQKKHLIKVTDHYEGEKTPSEKKVEDFLNLIKCYAYYTLTQNIEHPNIKNKATIFVLPISVRHCAESTIEKIKQNTKKEETTKNRNK